MAVLRITTVRPEPEHREALARLFDEMNVFFSQQPGFISGMNFASHDGAEIGRLGVWESAEHADAVAQMTHTLALRSRVIEILGHHPEDEREEVLYQVTSVQPQ